MQAERYCCIRQRSLPQHDALATQTHDPSSNTTCWIGHFIITPENQLVSSEGSHILRAVYASKVTLLNPNQDYFKNIIPILNCLPDQFLVFPLYSRLE